MDVKTSIKACVNPVLSVIMPTYNRGEILEKVLHALHAQQGIPFDQVEVVVVDDCSKDRTHEVLAAFARHAQFPFQYRLLDCNGGPARARNAALEIAKGDVILIIGDDILPDPELLKKHMEWHLRNPGVEQALLGYVTWPSEIHATPFMRWLETGGRHYFFNYADIPDVGPISPIFFYTCNVSVKRELLLRSGGFDESFPFASHEDIELGYRLQAQGMQLYYDRHVVGYHWHPLDLRGVTKRIYLMGHSSILFWQKAPDQASMSRRVLRRLIRNGVGLLPVAWCVRHLVSQATDDSSQCSPLRWQILLALAFWRGMHDGIKGSSPHAFFVACGLT